MLQAVLTRRRHGDRPPTSSPCPPPTWPAAAGAWRPRRPSADTPFSTEVDWRAEVAAARRARADADAESRRPELLARFAKEARDELGAAGPPLLAAKTEKRREQWVADRLVEAGRSRAKALGWPDAYAYTKALAERAVLEIQGDVPVTRRAAVDHRVGPGRALARAGSGASAWPSR